jgi:hypothetical protein
MLQTVEAEIKVDGTVTLLEPLRVNRTTRALVTVLENTDVENNDHLTSLSEFLESNEFKNRKSYPMEEIESQIKEARDSWE